MLLPLFELTSHLITDIIQKSSKTVVCVCVCLITISHFIFVTSTSDTETAHYAQYSN